MSQRRARCWAPERDLAIDFHGRISPSAARRLLPLLEPFHPLFVEEPVLPGENHSALARLEHADRNFAAPNFLIQEQSLGIHYNQGSDLLDYLLDPSVFGFHDGFVERTDRPGLWVDIDEDAVRAAGRAGATVAHAGVAARGRLLRRVVTRPHS